MSKKPTVNVETITPTTAENWLTHNFDRNRKLRQSKVDQYAVDIIAGRWRLSDQAISFDVNDQLVNGQHRLEAVLLAEKPIVSLVLRNLPTEAMLTLDGGMKRSTDDNFHIVGRDYPRQSGSTVRRILMGIRSFAGRAFTDQEVDEFLRVHGDAVRLAHRVIPNGRFASASIRAPIARAAIRRASKNRLEKFGEVLTTGMMVPGDEAAVLLRNYVLEELVTFGGGSRSKLLYAKAEAALASFLKEEKVKGKLKESKEELFPIPGEDGATEESPRLHVAGA